MLAKIVSWGTPLTDHLKDSREIFLHLVEKVLSYDRDREQQLIDERDDEFLELYVMRHVLGVS